MVPPAAPVSPDVAPLETVGVLERWPLVGPLPWGGFIAGGGVAKKLLRVSTLMLSLCERSGGRLEPEYAVAQDEVTAALAEFSSFVAQLTEAAAQDTPRPGR
jgi:hypothetical protein